MALNLLFFDTETTGLPKSHKAKLTDFDNWPRLVQIAFIEYSSNGERGHSGNHIIKPVGFVIPAEASKIHGITTERAMAEGQDLEFILRLMFDKVKAADIIIGHNISFDANILGCEFERAWMPHIKPPKERICTMFSTIEYCGIPKPGGGKKWPRLYELHRKLFGADFEGAHNAAADIEATAKCFWELVRIGVIKKW